MPTLSRNVRSSFDFAARGARLTPNTFGPSVCRSNGVGLAGRRPRSGQLAACVAVALIAVLGVVPSQAQPPANQHTLLLAQMDDSVRADFAMGRATATARNHTVQFDEGRFGPAVELREGQLLAYSGEGGNLQPTSGTIEFWLKPSWPGNDPKRRSIFSCTMGPRHYMRINTLGKGNLGFAVAAGDEDQWTWRRADTSIADWQPGQWHHVACTWGSGALQIFVDGQPGPETITDAQMPQAAPEQLLFGGIDGAIDAVRILNLQLSAEAIRREIALAESHPYRWLTSLEWQPKEAATADGLWLLGNRRIPLVLGNRIYGRGLLCQPAQTASFELDGDYAVFEATIGLHALTADKAAEATESAERTVVFEVWGDGKRLHRESIAPPRSQPDATPNDAPSARIVVPISGVRRMNLTTRAEPPLPPGFCCVWAAAVLKRDAHLKTRSGGRRLSDAEIEMYRRQLYADRFRFPWSAAAPYIVAPKFWEDDVDPSAPPVKTDAPELGAMATPDEFEPVGLIVYAGSDLGETRLEISDLRRDGAIIASEQVETRLVLRGLMRELYTASRERSRVVSRFLLPYRPVSIAKGTFREYHLTIHVPDDASPGTYRGTVRVIPTNTDAREIPLRLEVLPFSLDTPERPVFGMYYRFPRGDDWGHVELELADLRAHGVSILKSDLGVEYVRTDAGPKPSLERLQRGLELLRKHGFRAPLPVFSGAHRAAHALEYDPVDDANDPSRCAEFQRLVTRGIEALVALEKRYPEFEFLPTHMDEVLGRGRLPRYIALTRAVKKAAALPIYITLHNRPGSEALREQLAPYVDVRCYNGHVMDDWIRAGHTFGELAEELRVSGDEAWTYYNIRGAFFRAEWMRLINGFYLWASPLEGHVPWMYYYTFGNPLDDTDGPATRGHDFAFAVPDPSDPSRLVSTRHWEAFREGVDDARYLATLERLIALQPDRKEAIAARQWLGRLRNRLTPVAEDLKRIEEESPILISWSSQFDGPQYRQFRREAAEHLRRLASQPQE